MRDIRKDLRERIEDIRSHQEVLQLRIKRLEEQAAMLENLLKQEEADWQVRQPALFDLGKGSSARVRSELSRFLLAALNDGKPHGIVELVDLAQSKGIPIKGKSPRKAIHFALVGMKQNKIVEMLESGVWKIAGNGSGKVETP